MEGGCAFFFFLIKQVTFSYLPFGITINGIKSWKVVMGGERGWGSREKRREWPQAGKLKDYFNNIGKRWGSLDRDSGGEDEKEELKPRESNILADCFWEQYFIAVGNFSYGLSQGAHCIWSQQRGRTPRRVQGDRSCSLKLDTERTPEKRMQKLPRRKGQKTMNSWEYGEMSTEHV